MLKIFERTVLIVHYGFHGLGEASTTKKKKNKKTRNKKNRNKPSVPPEIAADPVLAKYWAQRYRLFSRFDEGIQLDRGKLLVVTHC